MKDKEEFFKFYDIDEFSDLWDKDERLVFIDTGTDELVARYEDIPDSYYETFLKMNLDRGYGALDIDDIDIEDDHSIDEREESKELIRELKKAVDKLGEPEREILIRYYFYYQKIEDISAYMKINPATVKVKLHRTRKKLKAILTERGFSL